MTKSSIPDNYTIKTENLSVLSIKLNETEQSISGFVKEVNSNGIDLVDRTPYELDTVQAAALLQLNLTNISSSSL